MTQEAMAILTAQVHDLVQIYSNNFQQFQRASYNETQLRVDFVNRFFRLLGWDVDNEKGLPQHLREVTHEATVIVEENGIHRSKKPDYSFRVGTEVLFFLETKKPSVNITVDAAPAFQLRRYGWSGNLKISVLTNFTDLYIYDCSVRPREGDDIGVAMIAHYHFDEYVDKFEKIFALLSKESAMEGDFERQFGNIHGALRREPFDQYFLNQIRNWRNMLGADILENNPGVDNETLNLFVQRILNRTLFLRFCEDRCLENYESLRGITTYQELRALFIAADRKYDSGLFALLDEDRLAVSDTTIIEIFQSLYYPNSSYEFGVIDPYIIGQIYELFLDETLTIQNGHITTEKKPGIIDSQGAINTPKNIADIIVEETLQPLYLGKTPSEVVNYRIADICCGSGSFLLSAFEYIVNYYIDYYQKNDLENALQRGDIYQLPDTTNYILSYELKRAILQNNIFGADIDPLAVEVSKFSLLLKALENCSLEELDMYCQRRHNRILPNLDENIKNGNSLVDMSYAQFDTSIYANIHLMNKLKMFDWNTEFGACKFDAIIGNPPYIRVQNLVHYSPEEYAFYKSPFSPYVTAAADTLDKYYLFIERGLALLNENGMLGYIVPHKFMNIKAGAKLRELLSANHNVQKILHFGTNQVFKGRSTYTCILILSKQANTDFKIGFVQDWNRFLFEHSAECISYPSEYISRQPWSFLPQNIVAHLDKIAPFCVPLSFLADIFVGAQTSADKLYIIHADREDESFIYSHDSQNKELKFEKQILRKSVYDAQLTSYERIRANSYIIFPYKEINGKPVLYTQEEMLAKYPYTFAYLVEHREELDRRNMPRRNEENWFAFGRSQSIRRFLSGEHLVWSVLSTNANYVYDDELVVFTGGGNGPFYGLEMKSSSQESIFYVQAILNHWLMELLVKSKASTFIGEYYSHGKQFIATLPIYKINFENPLDAAAHQRIVESVQTLMRLRRQLKLAPNTAQRTVIERSIVAVNADLNQTINALYQVDPQEDEENV